jgi:hypothetical protein
MLLRYAVVSCDGSITYYQYTLKKKASAASLTSTSSPHSAHQCTRNHALCCTSHKRFTPALLTKMVHHSAVLQFLRQQNSLQLSQQAQGQGQGQGQAPGPGNIGTQSSARARPIANSIPVNRCATTLATDPLQANNSLLEALLSRDMAQRQGEHLTHDQSLLLGILQHQECAKKHQESSLPTGLAPAPTSLPGMQKQLEEPASLGPHDQDARPSQQGRENTEDGESVRVPCRARGMPADHNFQASLGTVHRETRYSCISNHKYSSPTRRKTARLLVLQIRILF